MRTEKEFRWTLRAQTIDGGEYAVAEVFEKGQLATEILPAALSSMIDNIKFTKSMRWNASQKYFSRPVRWLLGLHGANIIPFTYADMQADRVTRGLRFSNYETYPVANVQDYFRFMQEQNIILDPQTRKQVIIKQIEALLEKVKEPQTLRIL